MGNFHPSKINVNRGEAEVDIDFRGVTYPKLLSLAVNIYIVRTGIILSCKIVDSDLLRDENQYRPQINIYIIINIDCTRQ